MTAKQGGLAMFELPVQVTKPQCSLYSLAHSAIKVASRLAMVLAVQSHAAVMTGDQLRFDWIETSGPDVGLTGSVDLTVGNSISSGVFAISSFSILQNGGFCG